MTRKKIEDSSTRAGIQMSINSFIFIYLLSIKCAVKEKGI